MDFTALVDVAIGLTLLYLGASLFVTIANEFIASRMRQGVLQKSLKELLGQDPGALAKQYPMLRSLLNVKGKPTSYADPMIVAQALIGALNTDPKGEKLSKAELQAAITAMDGGPIKNILQAVSQSSNSVEKFADDLAQWFDRSLTVMGETYKKNVQWISLLLGLVIAVGFNIDTISASAKLYNDKELRGRVANEAERFVKSVNSDLLKKCQSEEGRKTAECKPVVELAEAATRGTGAFAGMPMGWQGWDDFCKRVVPDLSWKSWDWLIHWIGYLLTALAISIGAPFWFDLLNRLINVRHGIRRPEPENA
jgi:hypothetical protein